MSEELSPSIQLFFFCMWSNSDETRPDRLDRKGLHENNTMKAGCVFLSQLTAAVWWQADSSRLIKARPPLQLL